MNIPTNQQFFDHYLNQYHQCTQQMQFITELSKQFTVKFQNRTRPTKQLSYLKRFTNILKHICYVSPPKNQHIETQILKNIIEDIYDAYFNYLLRDGWKYSISQGNGNFNMHIQQYLLFKLYTMYNKCNSGFIEQIILKFFFTLNFVKTTNAQYKLFAYFLENQNKSYEFFVFLILRAKSCIDSQGFRIIKQKHKNRIIQILQHQYTQNNNSLSYMGENSLTIGEDCQHNQIKIAQVYSSIQIHNLHIDQLVIYQLLKYSGLQEQERQQLTTHLQWKQIFDTCFQDNNAQIKTILAVECFEKIEELINILFGVQQTQNRNKIESQLCETLFKKLQRIFSMRQSNQSTELYSIITALYNYQVLVVAKFVQTVLKQPQFIELLKKY